MVLCLESHKTRIKKLDRLNSDLEAVREKKSVSIIIQVVGRIEFLAVIGLRSSFLCWLSGRGLLSVSSGTNWSLPMAPSNSHASHLAESLLCPQTEKSVLLKN